MTDEDLAEIEARLKAATPGPWGRAGVTLPGIEVYSPSRTVCVNRSDHHSDELAAQVVNDLDFIAHAPTDIAALLAEVRRLREEIEGIYEDMAGASI